MLWLAGFGIAAAFVLCAVALAITHARIERGDDRAPNWLHRTGAALERAAAGMARGIRRRGRLRSKGRHSRSRPRPPQ